MTIRDCRGSDQKSVAVIFSPIGLGTRFVVDGVEVTQAIQDLNNSVPLIAGKRTVARVYLHLEGPTQLVSGVGGAIWAQRPGPLRSPNDLQPPLAPYRLESFNKIDVNTSTDVVAKRRRLDASLNFELPPEWLTAGEVHIVFRPTIAGADSQLPCAGCDNANHFGYPLFVKFQAGPPLRLFPVSVGYTFRGVQYWPSATDFNLLFSWLRRAYPTADVRIRPGTSITFDHPLTYPDACDDVNEALEGLQGYDDDNVTRFYGVVSDRGGFMRGCSEEAPGRNASGPAGAPATSGFGWDNDSSYGDWYGGHEIGHMYGREHPGFCGQSRDDDHYPFPNGMLSGTDLSDFGFDVGDAGNQLPRNIYPPDAWTDVMTYCSNEWISRYTYEGILAEMRAEEKPLSLISKAQASPGESIRILGRIDLLNGNVQLRPFLRANGIALSSLPAKSAYSIDLFNGRGTLLARYPFEPKRSTDNPTGNSQTGMISEVVPFVSGTVRIVISKDGKELAARLVSANAPEVTMLLPSSGQPLTGSRITVVWTARDRDGDTLTFTLLYSTNGGERWDPIATGLTQSQYTVNLDQLPGSDRALFRVVASDGVNTATADSPSPFRVPKKSLSVHIASPANNATFAASQPIVLSGEVAYSPAGQSENVILRWSSDRQGVLGYGSMISATGLQAGSHAITLETIDGSDVVGRTSILVQVTAPIPVARPGQPQSVPVHNSVTLDGSASTGTGKISFQWIFVSKPNGSHAVITDSSTVRANFIPDLPGRYTVQLSIRDEAGTTAFAQTYIEAR
jgi:hypothetical protein